MKIESIQIGNPEARTDQGKEWTTAFYKSEVTSGIEVGELGLEGDGQADLKNHGGVDKAICVYSGTHYPDWTTELGVPMAAGAFGENFTISGETEANVCIGDIFECGSLKVQISQPRQPCWKLGQRWNLKSLPKLTIESGRTGWYLRVLAEGTVSAGSVMERIERPHPEWTIDRANQLFYNRKTDPVATTELSECPALADAWRSVLAPK